MDNNISKSNEVELFKLESTNISDPLQINSEDDCEIYEIKNLNSKSPKQEFKKQKQLHVREIDSNLKPENKAEQSNVFLANLRLSSLSANKTPSTKYLMNLVDFLKEDTNGKGILYAYVKNNRSLTTAVRKTLVHVIIQREKEEILRDVQVGEVLNDWDISKERLIKLANEIEANFDGESAKTYYMPFCSDQGKKLLASGKLLDHYQYVKRMMRIDGLLLSKYQRNLLDAPAEEVQSIDITDSEKNDLEFLQNHSEPFEEVKNAFLRTHNARRNIFHSQGISIFDYMSNSVKALHSDTEGPFWIDMEFETLHKGKGMMLFEKWPKIRNHLIIALKRSRVAYNENTPYMTALSMEPPDVQDILIFYLLHYITVDKKKRKRNDTEDTIKNALNEKPNSYFLHVEDAKELDNKLENLRETINSTGDKFRSVIAIVGPLLNVEAIYVVVNDIKYQTQSILHAIDLNIKIFYVFDYKFTDNVQFVWQFFQSIIYEIQNPDEFMCMKNRVLKGEIQHILNNSK
ncbi:uncharacterized protein LOC122499340 [Leptopilina heterotoma]|uniref:uncharacterized protein LOC122499340 n=1 Tax=Leptopilina heterotoma TaxID=63436 RepID=UPI001CAA412E|nr:uncharacterized protein LOC122499340 [Leptopilina heterotoma]